MPDQNNLKVGDKVQTRDGRPARIVCDDRKDSANWSLVVLITEKTGKEYVVSRRKDGKSFREDEDIILVPEHRFINVYRNHSSSTIHGSVKSAATGSWVAYEKRFTFNYVGTVEETVDGTFIKFHTPEEMKQHLPKEFIS